MPHLRVQQGTLSPCRPSRSSASSPGVGAGSLRNNGQKMALISDEHGRISQTRRGHPIGRARGRQALARGAATIDRRPARRLCVKVCSIARRAISAQSRHTIPRISAQSSARTVHLMGEACETIRNGAGSRRVTDAPAGLTMPSTMCMTRSGIPSAIAASAFGASEPTAREWIYRDDRRMRGHNDSPYLWAYTHRVPRVNLYNNRAVLTHSEA